MGCHSALCWRNNKQSLCILGNTTPLLDSIYPWRVYLTKVQQSFQSNRAALGIAGGHPSRRIAKATLDDSWNATRDLIIGAACSEKMWRNLKSQSRPSPEEQRATSLPRQRFARLAVFGFLWFKPSQSSRAGKHERAVQFTDAMFSFQWC